VVATVNLPLIDRGFVFHRKAHGQKNTVRGYLLPPGVCRRNRDIAPAYTTRNVMTTKASDLTNGGPRYLASNERSRRDSPLPGGEGGERSEPGEGSLL
jgi:hypothetical protein